MVTYKGSYEPFGLKVYAYGDKKNETHFKFISYRI